MPRNKPLVNVSAVVSPVIVEEIDRLAVASKVSRSQMVRQLLEQKLTERANERLTEEKDKLEQRLEHMENRFASLMVKVARASAQTLYLTMEQINDDYEEGAAQKMWEKSKHYAGQWLEQSSKKAKTEKEKK